MYSEIIEISFRSLLISSAATLMALSWSLPISYIISSRQSKLGKMVVNISNALVSVPTVIVGLFLYMLFSRKGPLSMVGLLYTPQSIALGESLLITPLLISLFHDIFTEYRSKYWELAISLGATFSQAAVLVVREAMPRLVTASLIGFGRAIGELGVALMVGGNIKGYTRVLTTSIALEVSKGEFEEALMLGIILLGIVFTIVVTVRLMNRVLER